MSDKPPILEPDPNRPAAGYAAYPRGGNPLPTGSPEKLEALMEGYYGLNWVFLWFVLLVVAGFIAMAATEASPAGVTLGLILMFLAVVAMGVLSYPCNKKIGFALGWTSSAPLLVSILMSVGAVVVSPVISLIIVQVIAMGGIRAYGIKGGFFGVRKKDIKAKIAQMRAEQAGGPPIPFQA